MFESDDFDQVLSQFDFPDESTKVNSSAINGQLCDVQENSHDVNQETKNSSSDVSSNSSSIKNNNDIPPATLSNNCTSKGLSSPKHTKRKIINSYFDHKSKRKFPGPAGLLTGTLEETEDENICQMELLSQDIDFSQNSLRRDLFESPLWRRLLADVKKWNLSDIDPIQAIKQQALAGNLRRRKAQTVTAIIESVDRSATDPLIILRDKTGHIKCTLHRDAWSTFSQYIVSECCALVLWKPTVLTTGSAFKKHYLNITLSNIFAIYSSAVLKDDAGKSLPHGYIMVSEEDMTVIKAENSPQNLGSHLDATKESVHDILDGLDNIFSDESF